MIQSSCLCGAVTWSVPGPLPPMYHCHCSRCRKSHGAAFATYVDVPAAVLTLAGQEAVASAGPPGADGTRRFCGVCGSVVPYTFRDTAFLPAGNFDGDPGARPARHIFTGSRARWYQIADALPQFEAFYPPDRQATAEADLPPLDPPGRPRGRCLCGAVAYVIEGAPIRRRYCHCGRCRKALSSAHAANMATPVDAVRFTRGEAQLRSYKLGGARFFTTVFCSGCGSPLPRRDHDRGIALIPLGSLDDEPGVPALGHIFVGSKAPWFEIADDLPRYQEYPPTG
jgi:hypothetical protein